MSCCGGEPASPEDKAEYQSNRNIEQSAEEAREHDMMIKKLLLLGAGESGKSTLFKQAISIYGKKMSEEELRHYVPIIVNNIVQNIKTLLKYSELLGCPVSQANLGYKAKIDELKIDCTQLNVDLASCILALWRDPGIQQTYERRAEYQLNDSTAYFFGRIQDVVSAGFLPNEQDVLRSRVRTTGIVETSFVVENNTFKMFDVGGQRNERKKWIHCFEKVTAVLFVAAISEYDQKLLEDEKTNRMSEALSLFEEIVNSKWFRKTSTILFLNKKDLFETKITKKPITVCPEFADYAGPAQDFDECVMYITEKFEERLDHNLNPDKEIYTHVTCATDSENMRVVFHAVQDIVIRTSLRDTGLL